MQRYRRKGKIIEPLVGTHMVAWLDGDVLVVVNRVTLDREYERVEEKNKSLLLCAACGKSLGYGEAYGRENGTSVFCAECWGVAQAELERETFRAKFEWERTHKGEWAKGPKDWWYRCADCNQPIPPSSDWLWKHGMCGSRICEACGKKRQAKKPKPVARVAWCMECGRKVKVGEGWFTFDHPGIWCQECGSKDEKPAPFGLCPGCNLEALPSQGTTYEGMTGKIWHTACVQKVQDKLKDEQKKSKPLTLADLKPGDVFRLVSHDFCQAKHQLLSAKEFWCSRDRKSITITHSEREVVLIAHHDLTPKQLLWIAATPEERKALDDSIREKWLPIMRGEKTGNARRDCFLCSLIGFDIRCHGCLLKRGNLGGCIGLGWEHAAEDARGCYPYPLARKFTMALASLLPNIDPLRIEVEATPVEWPGAKK